MSSQQACDKAEQVTRAIEKRLVAGQYRFGEKLSIQSLNEQFECGRQAVASALSFLGRMGYLEIIPQVGCRVVAPTTLDVNDFSRMYCKVEAVLAGMAAERCQATKGTGLIDQSMAIAAMPINTLAERWGYAEEAMAFHKRYGVMACSPKMSHRVENQRRIFRFYLWQGKAADARDPDLMKNINFLRIRLAEAIASRKVNDSEQLAERYVNAYSRMSLGTVLVATI